MATIPPAGTTELTYADLLDLPMPEEAGGTRYELLDGELLVTPSPVPRHQLAVARITSALLSHTDQHGGLALGAPMDVQFTDDTVFEPDVLEFWFVDLDADQVHAYRLGEDGAYGAPVVFLPDDQLTSSVFPGFTMAVRDAVAAQLAG